jgi:hypothetical protein
MAYIRKTTDILTSYDLDLVLEKIKDNSEVARLLLKKRHPIENLVDKHIRESPTVVSPRCCSSGCCMARRREERQIQPWNQKQLG